MPRMKAYISGPMSGLPEYNKAAFEKAISELRTMQFDVISPIELDKENGFAFDGPLTPEKYWEFLSRDLQTIGTSGVQLMFMLDGWWKSKGARIEVLQALLLGISVFEYPDLRPLPTAKIMEMLTASFMEVQ